MSGSSLAASPMEICGIHAWFLRTESQDRAAYDAALSLLSRDERARHDRLVFEPHRRDFAFAHALTRRLLARYDNVDPSEWIFETAPHGKPSIASVTSRPLSFNLSHTRGLVACVLAPGMDVGIDVETIDPTMAIDDIAGRHFADVEVTALQALTGTARAERFFELWTLKEAYMKAVGSGLSQPLDAMSFAFRDSDDIVFAPPARNGGGAYQFALFAPTPRHRLAVAARCVGPPLSISTADAFHGEEHRAIRLSATGDHV